MLTAAQSSVRNITHKFSDGLLTGVQSVHAANNALLTFTCW